MHILEHKVSPAFYIKSTNRIIDSPTRVSLTPLTKSGGYLLHDHRAVVHYGQHHEKLQRWTYMAFESTYASWLTLIHFEYVFPWDAIFLGWFWYSSGPPRASQSKF
jgi:hypothetical protein